VRLIVEQPVHTIETNIKTTELVLERAARTHRPLLLVSTSEVYGKLDKPSLARTTTRFWVASPRPGGATPRRR
jgi:UDP-glucose 4-epimerase